MSSVNLKNILKASTVLVIDNKKEILQKQKNILELFLQEIFYVDNIAEAQKVYNTKKPDIIISEIKVGDTSCLELLKNIREYNYKIPIIITSKHSSKESLLELLTIGIIDFIEKPIFSDKFIYVLNKTSKHIFNYGTKTISIDKNIHYDYTSKYIVIDNDNINLTQTEARFLELLLSKHGQVFSQQAIEVYIWGDEYISNSAFKSLVKRVRAKVGKSYIQNNSGHGYYLVKN